ncbi:MAG: septum formation initiator family protein [Dactylosporangium sp.]|nr:septum formation initiator family protein [Dactylosporangium sp.]NNJ63705.1 septum formation initiator family protein [Dactylosporangium sp.]
MTQQRRTPGARGPGWSASRNAGARAGLGAVGAGRGRGRPALGRTSGTRAGGRSAGKPDLGTARPVNRRNAAGQAGGRPPKRMTAAPEGGLTGRAAVLAMVLLGLLLAYAYPVRVYLAQQAEIAAIEAQQSEQRRKIGELAEERAKWDDPEYVKSQARRRLQYTLPGETPYVVIGGTGEGTPLDEESPDPEKTPPWYGKLWSSLASADRP